MKIEDILFGKMAGKICKWAVIAISIYVIAVIILGIIN